MSMRIIGDTDGIISEDECKKIKCLSKSLTAQILTYVLSDFTKGNGNKEVRMRY